MSLSSPRTALSTLCLLLAVCTASLGQQRVASPAPTPERALLTTLPPTVLDVELRSARGRLFRLSDYSGKVLVINLWATWLGPSRMEVVELVKLQKDFWSQGVRIVGLSIETPSESVAAVRQFVADYQIQYRIGWSPPNLTKTLLQDRDAVPQTYVISGTGRIVERFVGFNTAKGPAQLREAIEEALKESAVSKVPSTQ